MLAGLKLADSSRIEVVVGVTSLVAPPITPATAMALLGSAITRVSAVSWRSIPSSVVMTSPSAARRMMIFEQPILL
jgi:hypothetical protein